MVYLGNIKINFKEKKMKAKKLILLLGIFSIYQLTYSVGSTSSIKNDQVQVSPQEDENTEITTEDTVDKQEEVSSETPTEPKEVTQEETKQETTTVTPIEPARTVTTTPRRVPSSPKKSKKMSTDDRINANLLRLERMLESLELK